MAQGFDLASVQALYSQLVARAETRQFRMLVGYQSQIKNADHPFVRVRARGPKPWLIVSWAAVYRSPDAHVPIVGVVPAVGAQVVGTDVVAGVSRHFGLWDATDVRAYCGRDRLPPGAIPSECVACDASDLVWAQGMLLVWARQCFDQHDMRMRQAARPPARHP